METSMLLSEDKEDTVILEEGRISKTPISTASGEHYFCTPTTVAGEKSMSQTTCGTTQLKKFLLHHKFATTVFDVYRAFVEEVCRFHLYFCTHLVIHNFEHTLL